VEVEAHSVALSEVISAIQFTNWDSDDTLGYPYLRSFVVQEDYQSFFSNPRFVMECFECLILVFRMTREISFEISKIERDCFDRVYIYSSF